jgi:membrane protein DedA with SNARE-associated domain
MPAFLHHLGELVAEFGLPALFVSLALESLGAPLPGESAILIAAGSAAAGEMSIRAVAITAFAAAVLGDSIGYLIGRRLGRPVIARYGARFGATEANLARVERLVQRHGAGLVVVARFFIVLRQLNGLVAGMSGMRWPVFLAANVLGAAIWVGLWTTLAYRFGLKAVGLPALLHHLAPVAGMLALALIATLAVLHFRRRHPAAH